MSFVLSHGQAAAAGIDRGGKKHTEGKYTRIYTGREKQDKKNVKIHKNIHDKECLSQIKIINKNFRNIQRGKNYKEKARQKNYQTKCTRIYKERNHEQKAK